MSAVIPEFLKSGNRYIDPPFSEGYKEFENLRGFFTSCLGIQNQAEVILPVLGLFVIHGQVEGIFCPVSNGKNLVTVVLSSLIQSQDQTNYDKSLMGEILLAVRQASSQFNGPPYTSKPSAKHSPLLHWLARFVQSPVYPLGLQTAHINVIKKAVSVIEGGGDESQIKHAIANWSNPFLKICYSLTNDQILKLKSDPSNEAFISLLTGQLDTLYLDGKAGSEKTYNKALGSISYILSVDSVSDWKEREYGGSGAGSGPRSAPSGVLRGQIASQPEKAKTDPLEGYVEYEDLPEDHPDKIAVREESLTYQNGLVEIIQAFGDNPHPVEDEKDSNVPESGGKGAVSKKDKVKGQVTFFDPWQHTLFTNFCRESQGVLTVVELALLLQSTYDLEQKGEWARAKNARLVLLGGVLSNWTDQLVNSSISGSFDESVAQEKLTVIPASPICRLFVKEPVGYPDQMRPGKVSDEVFQSYKRSHDLTYEPVTLTPRISMHPVVRHVINDVIEMSPFNNPLIHEDAYDSAIQDLTTGLQHYFPSTFPVTAGGLSLTFEGFGNSLKFDPFDRWAVSGKALPRYEMMRNYTWDNMGEISFRQWLFINQMVAEIIDQHKMLQKSEGFSELPQFFRPANTDDEQPFRLVKDNFVGSWSVPKISTIKDMFSFVRRMSKRKDIPLHEAKNWWARLTVFSAAFIKCMRDYDVDGLPLIQGYERNNNCYTQKTKFKKWEEQETTFVLRHVPDWFMNDWWTLIRDCARDYVDGPILCLRDADGKRLPFKIQDELNFTFEQMGIPHLTPRAYGLRHLGRTVQRMFGLRPENLDFKLNHYGDGYEKYNPVRGVVFYTFSDEDAKVTLEAAKFLGIVE